MKFIAIDPSVCENQDHTIESNLAVYDLTSADKGELIILLSDDQSPIDTNKIDIHYASLDQGPGNSQTQSSKEFKSKSLSNSGGNELVKDKSNKTARNALHPVPKSEINPKRTSNGKYDPDRRNLDLSSEAKNYDNFALRGNTLIFKNPSGTTKLSLEYDKSLTGGFMIIENEQGEKRTIKNARPYLGWFKNIFKGIAASEEEIALINDGSDIDGIVGIGITKPIEGKRSVVLHIDVSITNDTGKIIEIIPVEFPMDFSLFEKIIDGRNPSASVKIEKEEFFSQLKSNPDLLKILIKRFNIQLDSDEYDVSSLSDEEIRNLLEYKAKHLKGVEISKEPKK